ncbi:phosphate ABC transporter substrate-binding protein [Dyella subtropica]|uniref:phosphate ABC transporter substrate-binding protein n=1 Tax=Dyella subtropica TaxID=2992127 RepID=UPI00224F1136|nr:phosphate ABC transporter substrate-binding protein [Dyella subtropica]
MIRTMMKWVAVTALTLAVAPAFAGVAVIVSAKSDAAKMSKDQVADLYLGKSTAFPGGGSAKLFDQPESSAVREQFYQKLADKSASQVKAVWSRLIFSGKALPPKEASSDAEVKKAVASGNTAVGYIDASAVDATVKVVLTLP